MTSAIRDSVAPGAALAVGRHGRVVHMRGYGSLEYDEMSAPVTDSTIWDLASLTKVVGTTTALMVLEEEGLLDIERPVRDYLPELDAPDKAGITVRMLLEHNGGLEAFAQLWRTHSGRSQYLEQINARPAERAPGDTMVYSDWDFVLLGLIVERITGLTLNAFLRERVWQPLRMRDTDFHPGSDIARVAPTEMDPERGGIVRGFVHDENAYALGGVAGHAGLFSSARDLAVFARFMMDGGIPLLEPSNVARWTARQGTMSSRALGWDTPSPSSSAGRFSSPRAFGHTGFTGTSIWMDPEKGLFVVLLTNRVNPTRVNQKHIALRRDVIDAVHQAVVDAPVIDWEARMAPDTTGSTGN
jgi:CubicO group peptidase (beta-lactamase class C family)